MPRAMSWPRPVPKHPVGGNDGEACERPVRAHQVGAQASRIRPARQHDVTARITKLAAATASSATDKRGRPSWRAAADTIPVAIVIAKQAGFAPRAARARVPPVIT